MSHADQGLDAIRAVTHELPRRDFMLGTAATVAGVFASTGSAGPPPTAQPAPDEPPPGRPVRRPNIILFITDQERAPMHWPAGWADENLPHRRRLMDHGLSFENAFCATAMCSPSRSTFFTGKYPAEHGVTATLTEGGTLSPFENTLPTSEQNMATILGSAGYRVHFRGKWHISKGADGGSPSPDDIADYGFLGWQGPDFGGDTAVENFGGGCVDNDGNVIDQAVEFLSTVEQSEEQPFALIISLANPHDILSFPKSWDQQDGECDNYGSAAPGAFLQGIDLPPSYTERLALNHKPSAQVQSQLLIAGGLGPLPTERGARDYANFYAYLHTVVDQHLGTVLDVLDSRPEVRDRTVLFRISDHGEMGMSHGGLRQKAFNAYDETLRVPLIVSNPVMFPQPVRTDALASLVDLMPTMAELAEVPDPGAWTFRGTSLAPVIAAAVATPATPTVSVQDSVMFTFDDQNAAAANGQDIVTQPNHIRAIRDQRYKYAVYFDPAGAVLPQTELYDTFVDPDELRNLADPTAPLQFRPDLVAMMQARLMERMQETHTMPDVWPTGSVTGSLPGTGSGSVPLPAPMS
ncbi:sulfatase [Dietzia sp. UCD-THP]|uniref:sulfatase-like hydrolase/transferase n=1 Tax=Dietzia sp. UCD-THP TaxID=1292020 RepID=UPI00037B8739|nr:sulfatase-like hydrolase/transferase [Dietzia sp. UCD-THP]EYT56925.1 sulfatase [Dietzia sp. UCD-THP]